MRVTFKVLDSLSLRPLGTRPSELPDGTGSHASALRRPAVSPRQGSRGRIPIADSHGGGALEARCLAVPRWAAFYVFIDVAWRWCDVRTQPHIVIELRTGNSLTRVARPRRPNTVWFSEITRPLAVTRSRSGPLPVRPAAAGAARAAEAHTFSISWSRLDPRRDR